MTYIGQTKRLVTTRMKEHLSEAEKAKKSNKTDNFKSAIARHMILEGHGISLDDLQVVREFSEYRKLDVYESLTIRKQPSEKLLNNDNGNCDTRLFNLIIA